MNVKPIRQICRLCGKEIYLVKTDRGKTFPVDRTERQFVIGDIPNPIRYITQSGELYRGAAPSEADPDYDRMTGWPCHYDTCRERQKGR